MSVNNYGINSTSINSTGTVDNKLVPLSVYFRVSVNADGFLARRYLYITGGVGVKFVGTAVLGIKKPLTNNGIGIKCAPLANRIGAKISLGVINEVHSLGSVISQSDLFTGDKFYVNPVAINVSTSSILNSKTSVGTSITFCDTVSTGSLSKLRTLGGVADIGLLTAAKVIKKGAIRGNVVTNINTGSVPLIGVRKINTPVINIAGSIGKLSVAADLKPSPVVINVTLSNVLYAKLYDKAPFDRRYIVEADFRSIVIPEEIKIMNVFKKQPADSYDYDFTYEEWLMGQDWVESVVVTTFPDDAVDTDGLQVEVRNLLSPNLKLWISGGKNGVTYKVTVTATTVENRIKQSEFKLKIKDI